MYLQNFIKISHIVEDLRQIPYFHIFLLRRCLGERKVDLASVLAIGIYQYAKNDQNIPKTLSAKAILTDHGQTDGYTRWLIIGHSSKVNL